MNGSLLKHKEVISVSEITSLSSQELNSIYASLSIFIIKGDFSYNSSKSYEYKSELNYTLEFQIEFEDINSLNEKHLDTEYEFIDQNPPTNDNATDTNLDKYREDVAFMLEDDGIIDDVERKLLNRKIERYGLSQSQAEQVEKELMFTVEEVKYLDEYKTLLEEGEIGDLERKMLNRYAKRYKISKERQLIIEAVS